MKFSKLEYRTDYHPTPPPSKKIQHRRYYTSIMCLILTASIIFFLVWGLTDTTESSTKGPTSQPTLFPTNKPTKIPTTVTQHPSPIPTSRPTEKPSGVPSAIPSSKPTNEPTKTPTEKPTVATCWDKRTNGDETAPDCGGGQCGPCDDGLSCKINHDCKSDFCDQNITADPRCQGETTTAPHTHPTMAPH